MKETEEIFFNENNIMYNNFLNKYYYNEMTKKHSIRGIELILLPFCNLQCKYCYVHKTYSETYTNFDINIAKENLKIFLEWYTKKEFQCNIDLFSGELFSNNFGYEFLDIIYEHFKDKEKKPRSIVVPTNYTFIADANLTSKVENIINKFNLIGINIYLSASFDGKYMEVNRPTKDGVQILRDDNYYERCFAFNAKHKFGFHPMIYADNIELWEKNFLWFVEKFKKYDLKITDLYLLTVRNDNWTEESCKHLYNFYTFLINWLFDYVGQDSQKMYEELKNTAFNSLSFEYLNTRTGIGCGIQDYLHIRISDLRVFQCHRLMYPDLEIGQYDSDMNFHTTNAELGIITCAQAHNYWPICSKCPICSICNKGCLGAQFEIHGDMYIPCHSVCQHYFYMLKAIIDGYYRTGVIEKYLKDYPWNADAIKFLREQEI